ncbi:MAG: hypothetical protein JNL08_08270 [Planctomycetes bacterium]|nr:hypothetical protein [Planctomycetota bacterium]
MPAAAPSVPRRLPLRRRLLFALVPLAAVLLVAELAIRLVRAPLHFGSFREFRVDLMRRNYPAERDPQLGYVPRANFASTDNHWGTRVSIDEHGLRRNGGAAAPADVPAVVAVGDSFTFGDQVDDDASWPAQLEPLLGRPVRNGGVFGYSLTQAVLRGEQLVQRFAATDLVVSFIAGDLERCEYSKRYTPVPWFDLRGDELVLQPVPADDAVADPGKQWKDLLGHSALLDAVFANTSRAWWYENEKQVTVPHLVGRGREIGERLMDRIAAFCRARGVRLLVVLQGEKQDDNASAVLARAQAAGARTLDLVDRFLAAERADPSVRARWFDGHMTRAGNGWVAAHIAVALQAPR